MVSLRGSKWGSKCAWLIDRNRNGSVGNGGPSKTETTVTKTQKKETENSS